MHVCKVPGCPARPSKFGFCKPHWQEHGNQRTFRTHECPADDCNTQIRIESEFCYRHTHHKEQTSCPVRRINPDGYMLVRMGPKNWVLEHRVVMEECLGRNLFGDETVHHINGIRHDNRPANLELWASSQPAGQRVTDLVSWAEEILDRYKPAGIHPSG